jgi:AraC-like DNA-binding protein
MPGYIDVYNPADLHEVDYRNTESVIFHLKMDAVKKIYGEIGGSYQHPEFDSSVRKKFNLPLSFLRDEMNILKNVQKISQSNSTLDAYCESKVLMLLSIVLDEIKVLIGSNCVVKTYKLEKSLKWLKKNFYRDDITISFLAELSCLSKFHFIRTFRNIYGKTPYDYLMEIRVQEAIKILKEKKYRNLEEVSAIVGFRNAAQLRYHLKK